MRIGPHEVDPTPIAPGGGAQGVYRGIDGVTGQQIAVKVLGGHASTDVVTRNKFEAEFSLLESFVHPFSATGYRWGEDADQGVFFTMPFFSGGDWYHARRDASPVALGVLVNRFVEVVGVLMAAHRLHPPLLHRDLKPSNILLHKGQSRVADWGIARPLGPSADYTQSNGTPGWRAPEQAGGQTGTFTDVWGLAGLIGWVLTGERAESLSSDVRGVLGRQGWSEFAEFFEQGLAESPTDRFASVNELWTAFAPFFGRVKRALWERSSEPLTDRARMFWPWRVQSSSANDNLQPRGLVFEFLTSRARVAVPYGDVSAVADRVIEMGPRLLRNAGAPREQCGVWRIQSDSPPFRFEWIHGPKNRHSSLAKRMEELSEADADVLRDFFFLAEDRIEPIPAQLQGPPED